MKQLNPSFFGKQTASSTNFHDASAVIPTITHPNETTERSITTSLQAKYNSTQTSTSSGTYIQNTGESRIPQNQHDRINLEVIEMSELEFIPLMTKKQQLLSVNTEFQLKIIIMVF